jgi:predicted ATPase
MRIRRRIAERKIDRAVTLLSVGHREPGADSIEPIRAIKFDEEGNPDAWPEGVFEETFKDLAAIHSL